MQIQISNKHNELLEKYFSDHNLESNDMDLKLHLIGKRNFAQLLGKAKYMLGQGIYPIGKEKALETVIQSLESSLEKEF